MFTKDQRSTPKYWFAHWCAFQMTALNLGLWKPKYLLHDIEKPFLLWLWKDYKRVQSWHRKHNAHHAEYMLAHDESKWDIEAMVIDNECSHFTKESAKLKAFDFFSEELYAAKENIRNLESEASHENFEGIRLLRRYIDICEQAMKFASNIGLGSNVNSDVKLSTSLEWLNENAGYIIGFEQTTDEKLIPVYGPFDENEYIKAMKQINKRLTLSINLNG